MLRAIALMYYQDNYSGTFAPSGYRTSPELQEYLLDQEYLWDAGMSAYDMVYGYSNQFTGLREYFSDNVSGSSKIPRYVSSYSFTGIQNHIRNNRPVILGTKTTHPQIANHHVVVHGFYITTSDEYMVVNDTFGHNNVYFTAVASYYLGYIYIN